MDVLKSKEPPKSVLSHQVIERLPTYLRTSQSRSIRMLLLVGLVWCATVVIALPDLVRRQAFDPTAQDIDVSGAHAFLGPGASDLRGPCPALNALANHGYIARNGYTTLLESRDAVVKVYGLGAYNVDRTPSLFGQPGDLQAVSYRR